MHDGFAETPRAEPLRRLPRPPEAERVLVIRLGAVGDVVRTRFAFAGVRELYPRAQIDWLVEDRAAPALDGIVGLDAVLRVPRRALGRSPRSLGRLVAFVRDLRTRRYELALDFHGILKSALLARLSGTPIRVGFENGVAREGSAHLYTERVDFRPLHTSRFERNAALVRFLGGDVPAASPPLQIPESVARELAALPSGRVVLHPGTSPETAYKRWQPDRYAELAVALRERLGLDSLVTWGPVAGERACAERIVARAGGAAELAPETPTILHVLELLRHSRLYLGSDSGPMHLASLAGIPVVALVGPTDPIENAPFGGRPARVVRRDVGCNPCREGCPARSCMVAIAVDAVLEAVRELVAPPPAVD